ncbi:PREDICTED: R3H domain-containing protein 1-like isoform X7 [Poecilia mexicana]|uniref:R3H domain-containing protein 1-like isoform X7 n=1 Tax=Poecilia mexicana TaxID=48701 RepID=UPI00072DF943|nr:PREDICTED: R3H domain-containing protein 1-like isoform X7 [Poecilia mexicana]
MRMSDIADAETMKVPEDAASPARDNTAKPEVRDQSHGSKEEHGGNNKKDIQPVKYSKSSTRLKLVRSLAVCEESFPLPIPEPSAAPQQDGLLPPPAFENEERGAKDQAEKEGGCDKVDKPEKAPRKMLSRDSSQDYTDSTGIDLHEFLVNTLKSNPRDRIMLLKLEQDILDFISNNETQKRKFPPMTSYHRMLLHRVAAYFGMDHNVDPSGKSVVINKTINTRIPDQKFSEHIKDDRADDFQKRYILKRDNASFDREDSTIRMRLKADKRSKSMEEREEEYQRARERIFAHDGEHFLLDRSAQEEHACMNTQQRRQMFRLRAGQSGASRQSSSETETLPRHGEPRPWSSTDSSDSSNRLAPRPAITKASSFSGLVRGDSTASSKSTGKLSKTGSESCSSVGSSSSSLSRPHLPLQIPAASRSVVPGNPLPHRAVDTRVPGHPEASKSGPSQLLASAGDTSGYYMLPLDAAGIPPGSILINPHTGKPFMHPDGSAVVYNPPAGRIPQQGKTPPQPIPAASQQQQPANHVHSQPDVLSAQFGHMTLLQQPSSDGGGSVSAPDGRHFPSPYTNPSAVVLQGAPPPQVSGYMVAGPSGGHPGVLQGQHVPTAPNLAYSNAGPAPFPALNQPLLQQHAYIQQPVQQMSTCYCSPAHHPQCSNQQQPPLPQYRPPLNPLTYNCPQSQNLPQQQVHQAMMPNPASSYQTVVGVQPTPSLALTGNQQSNMANQMQGMMVQYPPMQSYQQVSVPQQTYQQPMFVTCQPGQGAVAVSGMQPCYGLLPTNQHTTMSSTVSFLPAPMMEPLQFPQSSSPCVSQQHPGQQYAGLLPAAPGGGMVMLQMAAPPCQQPRASSPCQRKQPSHKHSDQQQQRGRRPADVPQTPDNTQSSLPSSPALTPSPCQPPHIKALSSGVSPIPILSHHPQLPTAFIHTGQGEAHYSLLGQPLQYKPSSIRPPLLHTAHMVAKHQGPLGVWRSGHGRKSSRKPLSSDLSVCREEISDGTASFFK